MSGKKVFKIRSLIIKKLIWYQMSKAFMVRVLASLNCKIKI